jgi:hypothetical protein
MANYVPPLKSNIPFNFGTGGYTPPDFGNLSINFDAATVREVMSDLKASIQVFDTRQETYTYLKYCERYIVGYTSAGVQIIQGKCFFGGIRDIGGFIRSVAASHTDLGAELVGLSSWSEVDLPAYVGIHPYYVLPAFIRGMVSVGFPASITGVIPIDLGGIIDIIPPQDLAAYIKARLVDNLSANIYGWQTADLGAYIDRRYKADLRGVIGVIETLHNMPALIRGWVREAYKDLLSRIHGFEEGYLPAFIRGTEFRNLGASLIAIQPVSLPARIHGWQEAYLQGIIDGYDWPWNLPASINGTGSYVNLPASVKSMADTRVYRDLPAYIKIMREWRDLPTQIYAYQAKDLNAFLNSGTDRRDLVGEIYPKMIRLTAVLSIETMEHKDLIGVINAACMKSDLRDLSAIITAMYMKDLPAYIRPIYQQHYRDLSAQIGHNDKYITIDKLPINVYIANSGYRTEDKIQLVINMLKSGSDLFASIVGELDQRELSAYIFGEGVRTYEFDYWKKKERVYDLHYGDEENYKDVDVDFETIVHDYLYSSIGNVATRTYIDEHWRTRLMSFYSPADQDRLLKRLYKVRILFDLNRFNSIDEAIRYGIDYVTSEPKADLPAYIKPVGMPKDLSAYISARRIVSTRNNLTSYINGVFQQEDDEVILNVGDGIQTIDI